MQNNQQLGSDTNSYNISESAELTRSDILEMIKLVIKFQDPAQIQQNLDMYKKTEMLNMLLNYVNLSKLYYKIDPT